jgi:DNA-binding transcriptional ArsR family regulator
VAETARWRQRLEDGATFRDVIERRRIWKGRPSFEDLADASAEDGRLVLSPGWFYGDVHVVELDGMLYLGHGIQAPDTGEMRRAVAAHVSSGLKAVADPTRLAILMWLAREPASVTEIARQFKLAQPTVSAHVQVLREAGLLEERISGRSARLSTSEETVRRFFGEAQESLFRTFRS